MVRASRIPGILKSPRKKLGGGGHSPRGPRKKWLPLFKALIVLGAIGAALLLLLILYYAHDLPDTSKLNQTGKTPSIQIVTESGQVIASYGDVYGDYVPYKDIPRVLIDAVMATEDRRFFEHGGVDFRGILRAMFVNAREGRVVQGGSTITQQLAKFVFLNPERSIKRKVQELILALWLEQKFSKEQIMEIYLNRVYLGAGNYGVDAASRSYFGKSARQLKLEESALLAGLLKAPSKFAPSTNPEVSLGRANQVIEGMVDGGFLKEKVTVTKAVLTVPPRYVKQSHFYFADWVLEQLPNLVGITQDDLTVITTFSPDMQQLAEESMLKVLKENPYGTPTEQAALLVMSPSGEIRAMIGGRDYHQSQFNRATQAMRQPGSSFKPIVYLTAFEQGWTPTDVMEDKPVAWGDYAPKNYDDEYYGEVPLAFALAKSLNSVAVQLAEKVGIMNVVHTARMLGITSDLMPTLSLALGSSEVTLLEMTQAYAHLANKGYQTRAYAVLEVKNARGDILYQHVNEEPVQVIPANAVAKMNVALSHVIRFGTGSRARLPDRQVAGKTGTSQDFRDAWFIGYTGQFVCGVWLGNDNNTAMDGVTGGAVPATIFRELMVRAHEGLVPIDLPMDASNVPLFTLMPDGNVTERPRGFWDKVVDIIGGQRQPARPAGRHDPRVH